MEKEGSGYSFREHEKDFGGLTMGKDIMELRIYNLEDRLSVAQILIKNGYTVSQGKRQRSPTGKTVDYLLRISEDPENAETVK